MWVEVEEEGSNTTSSPLINLKAQNKESGLKKPLTVVKQNTNLYFELWQQKVFSFVHALRWSQFKRQLTKDNLQLLLSENKRRLALGLTVVTCFWFFLPRMSKGGDSSYQATAGMGVLVAEHSMISASLQENYIARFVPVAQAEQVKYGIPASVILGLAIVNSEFGTSSLSQKGNNHFNIRCAENHLAEGVLGQELIEMDCYAQYENAWTGFRANSVLLSSEKYSILKEAAQLDWRVWASGLIKLQYPNAERLALVIEQYNLVEFDQQQP